MSPLEAALAVVARDIGAPDWTGFLPFTLIGVAAFLAALPPDLTVAELAEHLQKEHP